MAGVRKKPIRGGKFQGWFTNSAGNRKWFSGTRNRAETLRMALRLEDDHRQVRLNYRPAAKSSDKHKKDPFSDVVQEYLAWGNSQGGRLGKPWGKTHARNRQSQLRWWQARLELRTLEDLDEILARVEKELRNVQKSGRTGKTVASYGQALSAFCRWCVQRGYLSENPLQSLHRFDTTPITRRRALTAEEIRRLLAVCSPNRRLLLETAFASGLRANELRNLTLDCLDLDLCGLHLDGAWTKNRKSTFQPLPKNLVERLHASGFSGEAAKLYQRFYRRRDAKLNAPKNPLLFVSTHPARDLDKDLQAAGIAKHAPGGKIDFHACRVAYVNFVIESGGTVKEAQALARHSTPQLTMNVYARTRPERLSNIVEEVGKKLIPEEKRVTSVQQQVVGLGSNLDKPLGISGLQEEQDGGGGGSRIKRQDDFSLIKKGSDPGQKPAETTQNQPLSKSAKCPAAQEWVSSNRLPGDSDRQKCVTCVQQILEQHANDLPIDLIETIRLWPYLPEEARRRILEFAKGF